MFITAMPNVPGKSGKHPGGGGSPGAIASVTACGRATGEAQTILESIGIETLSGSKDIIMDE